MTNFKIPSGTSQADVLAMLRYLSQKSLDEGGDGWVSATEIALLCNRDPFALQNKVTTILTRLKRLHLSDEIDSLYIGVSCRRFRPKN